MGSGRQENRLAGFAKVRTANAADKYQAIAANNGATAAAVVLGSGSAGDYLDRLLVMVTNNAASKVEIMDGATVIATIPAGLGSTLNQVLPVPIGLTAVNNWQITTGIGVSVLAAGVW